MPQLVINMTIRAFISICGKMKDNSFKLRYAQYSNRYELIGINLQK